MWRANFVPRVSIIVGEEHARGMQSHCFCSMGHFRVHVCLLFKSSLSAKNQFSFLCKGELINITKTSHLNSLWRGGRHELVLWRSRRPCLSSLLWLEGRLTALRISRILANILRRFHTGNSVERRKLVSRSSPTAWKKNTTLLPAPNSFHI